MPTNVLLNRFRPLTLAVVAACLAFPASAMADLTFKAGVTSYPLSTDGVTRTWVDVYLSEVGTTMLATDGGLNSFQLELVTTAPVGVAKPTLVAASVNPTFTGNTMAVLETAEIGGAFLDITSGVAPVDGEVYLGRFEFTGSNALPATTTYSIVSAGAGYTFTAADNDIGASIQSGTFTLVVPEPAGLSLLAGAGALLLTRRGHGHTWAAGKR